MNTTREMLKATTLTVADVRTQTRPWRTDGVVGVDMPPGFFVILEPRLAPLISDHCAVGLKATLLGADESSALVDYRVGRRQEDGWLCLVFAESELSGVAIGDRLNFVET